MIVDTRDIRSASQVARNFGAVSDEVEAGQTIVVVKNNRPIGVVAPMSTLERIDELDERAEDLKVLALAFVRSQTSTGELISLEESAAMLGIDLDALGDDLEDE